MSDLLELLHAMLEDGLTWSTAVALILAVIKFREMRVKRKHTEEMHRDIQQIKERMGIWNSGAYETTESIPQNSKPLSRLLRAVISPVKRLRRKMQMINKKWLIALLVAISGIVKDKTGYVLPDEFVNNFADWIWLGGVVGVSIWNMMHRKGGNTVADNYDYAELDAHSKDA